MPDLSNVDNAVSAGVGSLSLTSAPQPVSTMPQIQALVPVVKAEAVDVKSLHQELGYVEFEPSPRERMLIDVLVKTKSYKQAVQAVNEKFKRKHRVEVVKKWIRERAQVRFYLATKLKEAGMADISKDKWLSEIVNIAMLDKKINSTTPMMFKLIGEAKGFFPGKEQSGVSISGSDLKINILQADGRA